jgi:hypothetical protein
MLVAVSTEAWLGIAAALVTLVAGLIPLGLNVRAARHPREELKIRGLPSAEQVGLTDERRLVYLPGRSNFVNRQEELEELIARVHSGRENVLTIEGDRWVGKSALAGEVAHALLARGPSPTFEPSEHSFVWMDAHDSCPTIAEICGHLARLTDDPSLTTVGYKDKRDRLLLHLALTRTVLLLDNVSLDGDEPSKALRELLEDLPYGALVLATVNRPGDLLASRVTLRDLDTQHVGELIDGRVEAFGLDGIMREDRALAARVHELIGGNPGVVEWFLRSYRQSSESIDERLEAVAAGSDLDQLFGPTWESLAPSQHEVLSVCAVLRGEATGRQVAEACSREVMEVRDVLRSLHRAGLLAQIRAPNHQTLYTCARAFQVFVASQTTANGRELQTDRLADGYVAHFREAPEDAAWAIDEVRALRVVREELYGLYDDERMQALFRATLDILFTLGQFDELIAAADLAYLSAERAEAYAPATHAAMIGAVTHAIRGEMAQARERLAYATLMAESAGDPASLTRARRCRGFVLYRSGRAQEALAAIEGVDALAEASGDVVAVVDVLDLRTSACWYLGRLEECEAAARASLAASSVAGWERAGAYPLRALAELALHRRQHEEARRLLDQAATTSTAYGDLRQQVRVDVSRARLELFAGDLSAGRMAAKRAATEAARLGLPPEQLEASATARAIGRASRSKLMRRYYAMRRPRRLTDAPIGGD